MYMHLPQETRSFSAASELPITASLLAHSDGDVLIHALCDALLGALALGDIGVHFPPSDSRWKGVDSSVLLAQCHEMVRARGHELVNADITVICEMPKITPHVAAHPRPLGRRVEDRRYSHLG